MKGGGDRRSPDRVASGGLRDPVVVARGAAGSVPELEFDERRRRRVAGRRDDESVRLTDSQKALLLNLIIFWADQSEGALPPGIYDLRYALHDDLRNVASRHRTTDPRPAVFAPRPARGRRFVPQKDYARDSPGRGESLAQ